MKSSVTQLVELAPALAAVLGADSVHTSDAQLDAYTADTYWPAISARAERAPRWGARTSSRSRARRTTSPPRCASPPPTTSRSSPGAAGPGTQGGCVPVHGGLVIDLRALNQIIEIDERSMSVTAQAGVNGDELERGAQRARPDAPALPGLVGVGDGRRLRRRARLGRALDALRQDRGPRALAAGRAGRRRADRHRLGPAPRRRPGAHAAVRRLGGHARDHHPRDARGRPAAARAALLHAAVPERRRRHRGLPVHAGRRLPAVRHPHVRRGGDGAHVRARRRRDARGRLRRRVLRGRGGRRFRGGVPHRRARTRGGRARARPCARPALVGPPLRVLQAAAPPGAAVDLGHDRRRRAPTRTSSASTRR